MRWDEISLRSPIGVAGLLITVASVAFLAGALDTHDTDAPGVTETTSATLTPGITTAFDDVQSTWAGIFAKGGRPYRPAKLATFTGTTPAACGFGNSAAGPFYCPSEERVVVDLGGWDGKPNSVQSYILAHEVGHHVQKQLGIEAVLHRFKRTEREGESHANERLELQADCFAGIWARSTDAGKPLAANIAEALAGASAISEQRLSEPDRGRAVPETFAHGSFDQRLQWFRTGFETGEIDACDTFGAAQP